jgi:hypothetical protein
MIPAVFRVQIPELCHCNRICISIDWLKWNKGEMT